MNDQRLYNRAGVDRVAVIGIGIGIGIERPNLIICQPFIDNIQHIL